MSTAIHIPYASKPTATAPDDHKHEHEHVDARGTYLAVYFSLMVLLAITVGAYYLKFDEWFGPSWGFLNTTIALIIATTKTALVMLVFMHLRHSSKLTWVISGAGFIWLCIMMTFTFADYLSRAAIKEADPGIGRKDPTHITQVNKGANTGVVPPGAW